jgi:hypothetical protein
MDMLGVVVPFWGALLDLASIITNLDDDMTVPILSQLVPGVHEAGINTTPDASTEYVPVIGLFGERVPCELSSPVPVTLPLVKTGTPVLSLSPTACGAIEP